MMDSREVETLIRKLETLEVENKGLRKDYREALETVESVVDAGRKLVEHFNGHCGCEETPCVCVWADTSDAIEDYDSLKGALE